jgi:hypothetical protein
MRTHLPVLAEGILVLIVGLWFLAVSRGSPATEKYQSLRETIDRLAALAAKDPAALTKEAEAFAKTHDSLQEIMNLFKRRSQTGKGGWGIGPTPTGRSDDGIEARIENLARKGPLTDQITRDADVLVQMSYRTAAIGEIARFKAPKKESEKEWKECASLLVKEALELAKALAAKDDRAVKEAAGRISASCRNCHGKFRD